MDAVAEVVVRRPVADVAAYMTDPANEPAWMPVLRSSTPLTPLPVAKGTRVRRVARFLGKEFTYVLEVEDLVPDRRLHMRSVEGPFRMLVTYEWEPHPDGTLARIRLGGDEGGYFRLFKPLVRWMSVRGIRRDLANVKREVEAASPRRSAASP